MKEKKANRLISIVILTLFAFVSVSPLVLVLVNSFKTHVDITRDPLSVTFSAGIDNYIKAWHDGNFGTTLPNSIILTGSTVVIVLISAFLAAYVLAGKRVRGSSVVLSWLLISMTIPVYLFLVPLYKFYANMGWLGNQIAVSFILAACNLPVAVNLMRAYFLNIPKELEEAARIDGCNTFHLLWRIYLPLLSPAIVTVGIIVGLNSWNDFLITSTFLLGETNFTAMLSLLALNGMNTANHGTNMAATVIIVFPIIIFFIVMQKRFIDGIVNGAVKG